MRTIAYMCLGLCIPFTGISQCDELTIVSVHINAFNEGKITVQALNDGQEIFSYPGFRIYNDANNELISQEEVEFFGIAGESWHNAEHSLQNIIPNHPYDLRVELWTDFYTELACTVTGLYILLPEDICAPSTLGITAMTNEPMPETLNISLSDSDGVEVLSDVAEFGEGMFARYSEICLAPGCYSAVITTNDAVITNAYQVFVSSIAYGTEYSVLHSDAGASIEFVAAAWADCEANGITDVGGENEFVIFPNPFQEVLNISGIASYSHIELTDASGRLIVRSTEGRIDTGNLPVGLYYLRFFEGDEGRPTAVKKVIRQ